MKRFAVLSILPVLALSLTVAPASHAKDRCEVAFGPKAKSSSPPNQSAPDSAPVAQQRGVPYNQSSVAFETLANRILENQGKFQKILSDVDNFHGAKYEIEQAVKTLRGIRFHELDYLKAVDGVDNVAVYGSTNIPLYTLILHAVIPASTGAHVWFRTPQTTRETYVKLMDAIRQAVPEIDLNHIHILTEAADIQYDNFRKKHVLGLNRNGTRSVRKPSEIVLFTGKPETGDSIAAEISLKMTQLPDLANAKTVFLKFGSGLNPVVVTQHADRQLGVAVNAAVQAVQINSSQDCIAPKFYAVHHSVNDRFITDLKKRLAGLRFGSATDSAADYSSLTFKDETAELEAFRTKWSKYLVNPEAVIDPTSKRVDPHLFVFPFSSFKDVELVDHFAPFLVVFEYQNDSELEQIANDPRIRSRAMFASIFGDPSSTQMFHLRKMFEDNFHSTILNQSVFVEESGNFPFGGYSANASSATLIQTTQGNAETFQFSRPILFSKEAQRFYGTSHATQVQGRMSTAPANPKSKERLQAILASATSPATAARLGGDWPSLIDPQTSPRPFGRSALQSALQKGFNVVINKYPPQNEQEAQSDRLLFGDKIVYAYQYVQSPKRLPGLMLHPSFIGREAAILNNYRGDLNPHLGWGYLGEVFGVDKSLEYWMADAIWPGSMPQSKSYQDFQSHKLYRSLEDSRAKVVARLNRQTQDTYSIAEKNELVDLVTKHVDLLFTIANDVFPQGAFVKNFAESTTGDLGNQITTFSQNSRNYALQFVDRFLLISKGRADRFSDSDFSKKMVEAFYETGTKMINKLLTDPDDLLIQQRVKIAKTDFGFPMEIRVDFIDGTAINSRARYSHEYLGEERAEAEAVLNRFFSRAPQEIRMLSGGADLVKLENGEWMFMEFNIGQASGSISGTTFPIESNIFLSRLQNRQTPLIQWLEKAFSGGVQAQRQLMASLKVEKEKWHKNSINDLSKAEVARYFRDRYLDEWRKNPSAANAKATLAKLRSLFHGIVSETNRDLPLLLQGAENVMRDQLLNDSAKPKNDSNRAA